MTNALKIENYCFAYGTGKTILQDFCFEMKQGQWLAIKGKSGCGKSTLIRNICALAQKGDGVTYSGKILVLGKEVQDYTKAEFAQTVGVVFQTACNRLVAPTVEEEIWFGLQNLCLPKEEIEQRTEEVLTLLQLSHLRHANPQRLSGGQQQMVTFAAVMALKPQLYIFDEVLSQFDADNKQIALDALCKIHEEGKSIIMIEHGNEAEAYATQMLMMGEKDD